MNNIATDQIIELRKKVLNKEFFRMNDMQREAVFHVDGPLLILAGAGSGKTTVLVNRIANIIGYGDAYSSETVPDNFTEDEFSAIDQYLKDSVPLPLQVKTRLAVNPCRPWQILAITFTNKAAGELKNRLVKLLGEDGNDIWASTFHSTCARMLRHDGDKLGYSNHFTIYDTDDSRRLMKECQKTLGIEDKLLSHKSILSAISHE